MTTVALCCSVHAAALDAVTKSRADPHNLADGPLGSFSRTFEILRTCRPLIIGDFNAPSAAKVDDGYRGRRYYDVEPYLTQDHDDLEFQVQAGTIGARQLADRSQTEVLLRRGFMVDAAAHLGAAWQATVGHWPDGQGDPDPWGPRRIDLILASRPIAPALVSFHTHTMPPLRKPLITAPSLWNLTRYRLAGSSRHRTGEK